MTDLRKLAEADDALIERLREEACRLSGHSLDRGSAEAGVNSNLADKAADRLDALRKRVAELEGALRPFAKYETRVQFQGTAPSNLPMVKDIERARAALGGSQ